MKKITVLVLSFLMVLGLMSVNAEEEYVNASDWAIAELTKADQDGFITDNVSDDFGRYITREEFCEIAVILYDRLGGSQALENYNPFTDTTNPIIIKAYNAEIINGVSATVFAPDDLLTREQLCAMIVRAMNSAGIVFGDENQYSFQKTYVDEESISSWAYLQVKIMNDFKIMNGSDTGLNPQGQLSVEQAIIMLERAYLREFEITETTLTAYLGKSKNIVIPSDVTIIANDVFHLNEFVESVVVPSSVTNIGSASFRHMTVLKTLTLNEGLIVVGEAAFELCEVLENITLPNTLESIGFMAFQDCVSFTEITIPSSVKSIDDQGFYRCVNLINVYFLGDNLESIGDSAFDECPNVVFVCEEGSVADLFATAHSIPVTRPEK